MGDVHVAPPRRFRHCSEVGAPDRLNWPLTGWNTAIVQLRGGFPGWLRSIEGWGLLLATSGDFHLAIDKAGCADTDGLVGGINAPQPEG